LSPHTGLLGADSLLGLALVGLLAQTPALLDVGAQFSEFPLPDSLLGLVGLNVGLGIHLPPASLILASQLELVGLLETRYRPCEARSALLHTVEGGAQHLDLLRGERTRLLQREKGLLSRLCIPVELLDIQFKVSGILELSHYAPLSV